MCIHIRCKLDGLQSLAWRLANAQSRTRYRGTHPHSTNTDSVPVSQTSITSYNLPQINYFYSRLTIPVRLLDIQLALVTAFALRSSADVRPENRSLRENRSCTYSNVAFVIRVSTFTEPPRRPLSAATVAAPVVSLRAKRQRHGGRGCPKSPAQAHEGGSQRHRNC